MKNEKREKNTRFLLLGALTIVSGILACVLFLISDISLIKIHINDYLMISIDENGLYSFCIDKERIKHSFHFPDDPSMPENKALDSLTLIVTPLAGQTRFEVGSYIDNTQTYFKEGGFILSETVWNWTDQQISASYTSFLSFRKTIFLKDYVRYRSDGNGNWIPEIDHDSLSLSIGDRLRYDTTLKAAVDSLWVSSAQCPDGNFKIETWSSFQSSQSVTVEDVLHSCGIWMEDTVFIIDSDKILEKSLTPLHLQSYCIFRENELGRYIDINKQAILEDFAFSPDSSAGKAVEALTLSISENENCYSVSVYSSVNDFDVIQVLHGNGVDLCETSFYIQK